MPNEASNRWSSARRALRLGVMACLPSCALPMALARDDEAGASRVVRPISTASPIRLSSASQGEVIDGRAIACCAARHWPPARALRARGETIVTAYADQDERVQQAARNLASFLNHQASYQEDIAAASGLRSYYARIAVQEQLQLSQQALGLVEREQSKHQTALQQGLATGVDASAFERRRLEIDDQQLQLRSQDRQLRSLLAQLARTDYDAESVQQEQLDVRATELDCQQLQSIALASRCDLRGWSNLANQVTETSIPLIGQMLATAEGGFGLPLPAMAGLKKLLCPPDLTDLVESIRRELNAAVEAQRRWICQTVEEKCHKLELAYRRIELAQQTVASWQQRMEQLEQLENLGDGAVGEHAAARVGLLKARAEEITRRLEARSAEIDLAEAVGGLARRCCTGQAWLVTGCGAP